jgi:ligand-binding sensor domain-containing protein
VLITSYCVAQPFYIKKYTVKDGLPGSTIYHLDQDSNGFLWVSTINGLSRFDGKEFINFGIETGLPDYISDAVYEDSHHRLWVGTRKGLAELRGRTAFRYPLSDHQSIQFVFKIFELRSVLTALTDKGMYQFENNRWVKKSICKGYENEPCRNLFDLDSGLLVNYEDRIVFIANTGEVKTVEKKILDKEKLLYLEMHRYSNGLFASATNGLVELCGNTKKHLFASALHKKYIYHFFQDSKNRFWVNTSENGLLVSEPGNRKRFMYHIPVANNLTSHFLEDSEHNIWVACDDGLLKISTTYFRSYDSSEGYALNDITNLWLTPDKKLHAGSLHNSIVVWENNAFKRIPGTIGFRHRIDAYCFDSIGRMWMINRERQMILFDGKHTRVLPDLIGNSLYKITSMLYNPSNRYIYVCSDSLKIGNENGFKFFRSANGASYIRAPNMIYRLRNGKIIVCTRWDGFFLIDNNNNVFPFDKGTDSPDVGPQICEENSGAFWISSFYGIMRYRYDQNGFPVRDLHVTTQNGLPNNAVARMTIDSSGHIWAATLSGLVAISVRHHGNDSVEIFRVSEEQGIPCDNWNDITLAIDSDGNLWAALHDNIVRIDVKNLPLSNKPPSIIIDRIQLNFSETNWSNWTDNLQGYLQVPVHPILPYNKNDLSISFKSISLANTSGIEYSYKLEGRTNVWSEPTKVDLVSFVGLAPGDYIFRTKARKPGGAWSKEAVFSFRILKPFWEKWWFQLLAVLIASALLAIIFNRRVREVRRKAFMQNQVREMEMKALKSQMNPHFIYNAMNSIQSLVLQKKTEEASRYISKFGLLLRQVLENSEKTAITLGEELSLLELYVELEKLRLNVNLGYEVVLDETTDVDYERVPPLIFQAFVENALWHGLSTKEGEKRISIKFTTDDKWLHAIIEDNGVGRKQADMNHNYFASTKKSKGIEITLRRLNDYNKNSENTDVAIVDLFDKNNRPAGTRIIMKIRRNVSGFL